MFVYCKDVDLETAFVGRSRGRLDALAWYETLTECWQRQVEPFVPSSARRIMYFDRAILEDMPAVVYGGRPKQLSSIHSFTSMKIKGGPIDCPLKFSH